MLIRLAVARDQDFIRELAGEVFSVYGDYEPLLPRWFRTPGVLTYISMFEEQRTGFVMFGFFKEAQRLVADVLAIAVVPRFQGRGIGRTLLEHAVARCEALAPMLRAEAIRLSVAETNSRAIALFTSCGFVRLPGDHGTYEAGQPAVHMERPLGLSRP